MAFDVFPGTLITPSRADLVNLYKRSYLLRNPTADTSDKSQPAIDAYIYADTMGPLFADANLVFGNTSRKNRRGIALDQDAQELGTQRLAAEGSSGFIAIVAAVGGVQLLAGQEGTCNGKRYMVSSTAIYLTGAQVPVVGIDTGPLTVQPAGALFLWTSAPAGLNAIGTVVQQANGTGLSGGHDAEGDDDLRRRLNFLAANPPASGNDAQYQTLMSGFPGLSVQAPFTYPSVLGCGTIGVAFTLLPNQPGQNRIPNATQQTQMASWLSGQMPATDVVFVCNLLTSPQLLALKISWAVGSPSWIDSTPWPPWPTAYASVPPYVLTGGTALVPSPTQFTLTSIPGGNPPQVGQNLGFYDAVNQVFRRKKILTSTINADTISYDIQVDTSLGISDTSYTPKLNDFVSPWSDSLNTLIPAIVGVPSQLNPDGTSTKPIYGFFDLLGPGEQKAAFFDPGLRERRSPRDPAFWASTLTSRVILPVYQLTSVQDAQIYAPTVPYAAPVGTPGVTSYLLTLGVLAAYP